MTSSLQISLPRATCPVCLGQQAVRGFDPFAQTLSAEIVAHGYRRPGWGYQVGNCPGVGFDALELSSKGAEQYRVGLESAKEQTREALGIVLDPEQAVKLTLYLRSVKGPITAGHARFQQALMVRKAELESELVAISREIDRISQVIAGWTYLPEKIVPAGEQERQDKREKAIRAAQRAEAKAAKEFKKALTAYRFRFRIMITPKDGGQEFESLSHYTEKSAQKELKDMQAYGGIGRIVELPIPNPEAK